MFIMTLSPQVWAMRLSIRIVVILCGSSYEIMQACTEASPLMSKEENRDS